MSTTTRPPIGAPDPERNDPPSTPGTGPATDVPAAPPAARNPMMPRDIGWFTGVPTLRDPRLPFAARLLLAMGVEVGWEIIENSPAVIAAYRAQALAAGYRGDSVLNSLSDTAMMALGFFIASRLPWWGIVLLALMLEVLAGLAIRDNLTFNILNFLISWPALEQWQQAWRP